MTADYHTIGMLSGTSIDAVDAVLVAHAGDQLYAIDGISVPMPAALQADLRQLCHPGADEINRLGACDTALGELFADVACQLMARHPHVTPRVLGCHGQAVRHHPNHASPFTLQIGNPHVIAARTGIHTVADFRRRDVALGGQGAPLAPGFHAAYFGAAGQAMAVVNIGGMSNITLLDGTRARQPTDEPAKSASSHPAPQVWSSALGFDTGPGNCLMDAWVAEHTGQPYDAGGAWAMQGQVLEPLLAACLAHPFFQMPPPKSTGHEAFHMDWLRPLIPDDAAPEDVQRTLLELTAECIAQGIQAGMEHAGMATLSEWVICGGGAYNQVLVATLRELADVPVVTSDAYGVAPQWVEGMLFAWLADLHVRGVVLDWGPITGARQPALLGVAYAAPETTLSAPRSDRHASHTASV